MFIHGIKSEGESGCFCETSALADGTCNIKDEPNYNLYSYGRKGNHFTLHFIDLSKQHKLLIN